MTPYEPFLIGADVPGGTDFSEIYVDTVSSVTQNYLLERLVNQRVPVMLVGLAGTGKSVVISRFSPP